MIGSYIISVKENYPKGSPFSIKGFVKQLGTSIWALAAVVIVVFGVVGGVFTATESAAIAAVSYTHLNGRVKVLVYSGGELGAEQSVIQQMQFGGIDFSRVSLSRCV